MIHHHNKGCTQRYLGHRVRQEVQKKKETTVTVDKLSSHLYMHLRVRIHVVKQLLVVAVLLIPLQSLVIAEVISQRDKEDLAAVEFGLFAVLIQE